VAENTALKAELSHARLPSVTVASQKRPRSPIDLPEPPAARAPPRPVATANPTLSTRAIFSRVSSRAGGGAGRAGSSNTQGTPVQTNTGSSSQIQPSSAVGAKNRMYAVRTTNPTQQPVAATNSRAQEPKQPHVLDMDPKRYIKWLRTSEAANFEKNGISEQQPGRFRFSTVRFHALSRSMVGRTPTSRAILARALARPDEYESYVISQGSLIGEYKFCRSRLTANMSANDGYRFLSECGVQPMEAWDAMRGAQNFIKVAMRSNGSSIPEGLKASLQATVDVSLALAYDEQDDHWLSGRSEEALARIQAARLSGRPPRFDTVRLFDAAIIEDVDEVMGIDDGGY